MKKLFLILITLSVVLTSCTKVTPSTLDYSKYVKKATLILQTQLNGINCGQIPVEIICDEILLQRVSDNTGQVKETIAFTASSFNPSVTALYFNTMDQKYYSGSTYLPGTNRINNAYKLIINLTPLSL